MNHFGKTAAFAISIVLLGGASAQAAGQKNAEPDAISVSYSDLNLSSQSGAQALFTRIRTAANLACGGRPDSRDLPSVERFRVCTRQAMDSAVTRIGAPKLSALYGQAPERVASAQ